MDTSEYVPAKYCSKCGELKPLSKYYLRSGSDQHRAQCKICSCKEQKDYNQENREDYCEYYRQYFQNNKERINEYYRNRYNTDSTCTFRITSLLRGRLYQAINSQGVTKYDNTMFLVGCTPEWLTAWLNYTKSIFCDDEEPTHIDHFFLLSAYDLSLHVNQQNAMNWKNLRVIPARMNQAKGNKMPSFTEINEHYKLINSFINYMSNSY